jgi:hypothetical protein
LDEELDRPYTESSLIVLSKELNDRVGFPRLQGGESLRRTDLRICHRTPAEARIDAAFLRLSRNEGLGSFNPSPTIILRQMSFLEKVD